MTRVGCPEGSPGQTRGGGGFRTPGKGEGLCESVSCVDMELVSLTGKDRGFQTVREPLRSGCVGQGPHPRGGAS